MVHLFESSYYGLFDLSTWGLWVNVNKLESYEDFPEINRLMMLSQVAMPGPQHVTYVNSIQDSEKKKLVLGAFSLYVHESRHWHDFTSTPFGLYYCIQTFSCHTGLLLEVDHLIQKGAVYVPLREWHENKEIIRTLDNELSELSPGVVQLINLQEKLQRILHEPLPVSNGIMLSSMQILEGLAILHQEAAVERSFGRDNMLLFRNGVRSSPAGKWYYAAIDLIDENHDFSVEQKSLILYLSLFGCPLPQYRELQTSPPQFLAAFLERLHKNRTFTIEELDVQLKRCLLEYQGLDPGQCLRRLIDTASHQINGMREMVQKTSNDDILSKFQLLWQHIVEVVAKALKTYEQCKNNPITLLHAGYIDSAYQYFTPLVFFDAEWGAYLDHDVADAVWTLVGNQTGKIDQTVVDRAPGNLKSVLQHLRGQMREGVASLLYTPKPNVHYPHHAIIKLFYTLLYGRFLFEGMSAVNKSTLANFFRSANIHQRIYTDYHLVNM